MTTSIGDGLETQGTGEIRLSRLPDRQQKAIIADIEEKLGAITDKTKRLYIVTSGRRYSEGSNMPFIFAGTDEGRSSGWEYDGPFSRNLAGAMAYLFQEHALLTAVDANPDDSQIGWGMVDFYNQVASAAKKNPQGDELMETVPRGENTATKMAEEQVRSYQRSYDAMAAGGRDDDPGVKSSLTDLEAAKKRLGGVKAGISLLRELRSCKW